MVFSLPKMVETSYSKVVDDHIAKPLSWVGPGFSREPVPCFLAGVLFGVFFNVSVKNESLLFFLDLSCLIWTQRRLL